MDLDRRSFLHLAGAAGAAALTASCTGGPPGAPPGSTTTTLPGATTSTTPPPPDWDALRRVLGGALRQPGEEGYDAARRSYNPLFDRRAPVAVAQVGNPDQVRACVDFARGARLPIAARSGGHSYAGYSTPEGGLVVDLRGLSQIDVRRDGTAVIGAGARLMDVYTALAKAGRSLPAGSCPTVGIAGLTLGGGLGVLARKYGLTCDKLLEAKVVAADGRALVASRESEVELFWALRGGGGGNFGVVTSFTFATDPAPDLTVFHLDFPAGASADVVGAWQRWTQEVPDELWSNAVVSGGSPPTCRVGGCFIGRPGALAPLLDRLVARAGARPTSRSAQQRGYLDAMRHFAGCARGPISECGPEKVPRQAFAASSRIMEEPLADTAALVALVDGRADMHLLIDSLGGAVAGVGPADTAFPHRGALATVQIYQETTVERGDAAAQAVAEVRDGLGRLGLRGGYVNYIEQAMPDWGVMYYGANLSRLHGIARRYDPDGVFTFPQAIQRA